MHTLKYIVNEIHVYCQVSETTRTERSCHTVRHGRHDRGTDNDNIVVEHEFAELLVVIALASFLVSFKYFVKDGNSPVLGLSNGLSLSLQLQRAWLLVAASF
jgi:hypothetical protein